MNCAGSKSKRQSTRSATSCAAKKRRQAAALQSNGATREILVIGYGNELRGDDAAGLHVAAALDQEGVPGVRTIVCHQLTPELAEDIAVAHAVIFVDASVEIDGDTARLLRIEPVTDPNFHAHLGNPGALLSLAKTLFGQSPPAWCLHVPAKKFELGAPLSAEAKNGISSAFEQIKALLLTTMREDA